MLAEALRLIRVFYDKNQGELAADLGISRSYLSEIESGKKKPTLDLLESYARVFDIPASSLLLFSESLGRENITERARVYGAQKILKVLEWLSKEKLKDHEQEARVA